MNEAQAADYFHELRKYGSVPGLRTIRELLKRLGNPQKQLAVISIAGTNGKGSVGAFLRAILHNAGILTASFSSPSVFHPREVFRLDDKPISASEYGSCLETVKEHAEKMAAEGFAHPTAFEVETAMAYLFAAQHNAELMLSEAGMGGRLDATNVCERNVCSVITTIAKDHTAFLGETLEEIAAHKAGILKEGCPVVLQMQPPQVRNVVIWQAQQLDCPLYEVTETQITQLKKIIGEELSLKGEYQYSNAALAVRVCDCLREQGYPIAVPQIQEGLRTAVWRGRFTRLGVNPEFWVDGAHNPNGMQALSESVRKYFPGRPVVGIMGVFKDKDYRQMARIAAGFTEQIWTVTPPGSRGLLGKVLAETLREQGVFAQTAQSVREAVTAACTWAEENEQPALPVIMAFGTLSFLKEAENAYYIVNNREKTVTGRE